MNDPRIITVAKILCLQDAGGYCLHCNGFLDRCRDYHDYKCEAKQIVTVLDQEVEVKLIQELVNEGCELFYWKDTPADFLKAAKSLMPVKECWTSDRMETEDGRVCSAGAIAKIRKLDLGFSHDSIYYAIEILADTMCKQTGSNITATNDQYPYEAIMSMWDRAIKNAEKLT